MTRSNTNKIKDLLHIRRHPEFKDITVTGKSIKIEVSYDREGLNGDFVPENPDDIPLLRFHVFLKEDSQFEDEPIHSVCTQVSAETPARRVKHIAKRWTEILENSAKLNRKSVERMADSLSNRDESGYGNKSVE